MLGQQSRGGRAPRERLAVAQEAEASGSAMLPQLLTPEVEGGECVDDHIPLVTHRSDAWGSCLSILPHGAYGNSAVGIFLSTHCSFPFLTHKFFSNPNCLPTHLFFAASSAGEGTGRLSSYLGVRHAFYCSQQHLIKSLLCDQHAVLAQRSTRQLSGRISRRRVDALETVKLPDLQASFAIRLRAQLQRKPHVQPRYQPASLKSASFQSFPSSVV
uniref:Uncharacterized protein n=1 Tax=Sphaerodactylus townsendi TaxID=933632 RepID=A0ACB8FCZ7_9SAUR